MPTTLITWNVNSVRTRLARLLGVLERHAPDVVCLQETKVTDDQFPTAAIEALGYQVTLYGQKGYNGVALLSRQVADDVQRGFARNPAPDEARVIAARLGPLRVVNVYVVNGQAVGAPAYQVKLDWLDALRAHLQEQYNPDEPLLVAGDFNVAPDDRDVHDPARWRGLALCSEGERRRLRGLLEWGLTDLQRHVAPEQGGLYTWWDYRDGAWRRNKGLRIDLVLGTSRVAAATLSVEVDRHERAVDTGPGAPSDHAPLVVRLGEIA